LKLVHGLLKDLPAASFQCSGFSPTGMGRGFLDSFWETRMEGAIDMGRAGREIAQTAAVIYGISPSK